MNDYERMNPYQGQCSKHGFWESSYDECPKCMDEEGKEWESHQYDHIPRLCMGCDHIEDPDDGICHAYKMPIRVISPKANKKKCKRFYQDRLGEW